MLRIHEQTEANLNELSLEERDKEDPMEKLKKLAFSGHTSNTNDGLSSSDSDTTLDGTTMAPNKRSAEELAACNRIRRIMKEAQKEIDSVRRIRNRLIVKEAQKEVESVRRLVNRRIENEDPSVELPPVEGAPRHFRQLDRSRGI